MILFLHSLNPLGANGTLSGIEFVLGIFEEKFVRLNILIMNYGIAPKPDLYLIPFDRWFFFYS